jgi:divalent metal cation (Fe/Co/Zn/Cd) transporter
MDSVFDPIANLVLFYCHKKATNVDLHRYPGGGARFETIGEIIYSGAMLGASVILIAFSIQSIATHTPETPSEEFHVAATTAVAISFLCVLFTVQL